MDWNWIQVSFIGIQSKEIRTKTELNSLPNHSSDLELEDNDKISKKPSRRKRGYQMREEELSTVDDKNEGNEINNIKNDKTESGNLLI